MKMHAPPCMHAYLAKEEPEGSKKLSLRHPSEGAVVDKKKEIFNIAACILFLSFFLCMLSEATHSKAECTTETPQALSLGRPPSPAALDACMVADAW